MKILTLASTLLFFSVSVEAFADFEGVMEMKMTMSRGTGTVKLAIGKPGVRSDIEINAKEFPMKMSTLFKQATPGKAYLINDANKSYSEIDISGQQGGGSTEKYTVKKIGKEKVNGFDSIHCIVTDERGNDTEVWTNADIADYKSFIKSMGKNSPANDGMMKALESVGAAGFITKIVRKSKNPEENMTFELVKADKKSMPASMFEIPAGYTKSAAGPAAPTLSPEAQKQLMEQMNKLTPEQREAIKRAMQGQQQPD